MNCLELYPNSWRYLDFAGLPDVLFGLGLDQRNGVVAAEGQGHLGEVEQRLLPATKNEKE